MIRGLEQAVLADCTGKNTFKNLTAADPGSLLAAKNVMILDDKQLRRAPGYALLTNLAAAASKQTFHFSRSVDQKQFVMTQVGGNIYAMNADGTGKQLLSAGETGTHQFVASSFICYSSDGHNAWRYVDVAGTLTKYKWGITPPPTAPSISTSAGTLTLTYGRTYVYCYVSRYTDSLGIQRLSISAPSPTSAHSGPVSASVVTLSNLLPSSDPQVNYIWIFEVTDSPLNTSATLFFAAEIPNGQTSYGDTLPDIALDKTRLAPFENFPAPAAPILNTFQGRVFAINGSLMQFSGLSEITLGIPEESWPVSNFFNIPSGKRTITAAIVQQQGTILSVCTEDYWFSYEGYNAATFTEQDRVAAPGAAGPLALCNTPFGTAFLSKSKQLWLWKPGGEPTDISSGIARLLAGTYTMESIDSSTIANAVVQWFEFGSVSLIAVFCRTSDAPDANLNLMQLWSIGIKSGASSGMYGGMSSVYEQISGIFQTDKVLTTSMTSAARIEQNGEYFLYLGDAAGNIYQFPQGFQDNAQNVQPSAVFSWILPREGKSRFYFIDFFTDRADALSTFTVLAATSDAPDPTLPRMQLRLQPLPSPVNGSALAFRANLQVPGLNSGRYLSIAIAFPNDAADAVIRKVIIWSAPLYTAVP